MLSEVSHIKLSAPGAPGAKTSRMDSQWTTGRCALGSHQCLSLFAETLVCEKFPSRTRNWVQGQRGEDGTWQRWACAKSAPKRKPPEASPRPIGDRAKLHHRSECDPQPCNLDEKYAKIKYKREFFSLHIYRCFCLSGFVSPALHQIQNLFPPLLMSIFTVAEETTPIFDQGHSRGATACVSPFGDSESE